MVVGIISAERKFKTKPVPIISLKPTRRVEKTSAFGTVAIGRQNAHEQAATAGRSSAKGWMSASTAVTARTGRRILAVAVFEANSVKLAVPSTRMIRNENRGMDVAGAERWLAMKTSSPDTCTPSARAKPAPRRSMTDHLR